MEKRICGYYHLVDCYHAPHLDHYISHLVETRICWSTNQQTKFISYLSLPSSYITKSSLTVLLASLSGLSCSHSQQVQFTLLDITLVTSKTKAKKPGNDNCCFGGGIQFGVMVPCTMCEALQLDCKSPKKISGPTGSFLKKWMVLMPISDSNLKKATSGNHWVTTSMPPSVWLLQSNHICIGKHD